MKRLACLVSAITLLGASALAQTPPAAPVLLGPNDPSPFTSGSWPAGSSDTGIAGCPALTPTAGFTAGTNGATYQNLDVTGQVVVSASNVTFRCVRLRAPGYRYGFKIESSANGTLLENVDVANASDAASGATGQGKCILVYGTNTTVRRADVSDCEDGLYISSDGPTLVEWSYIHAMKTSGTNLHSDGVQIVSGGNVTLRNNRIVPQLAAGAGVNSALTLESYSNPLKNVELGNNQFAGGNFVLYIFADVYNSTLQPCPSGVNIHDNQWLKGIYQYGYRYYGKSAPYCVPSQNGGAWTNNLISDGTLLPETDGGSSTTSTSSGSTAVANLSVSPLSLSASTVAGGNPASGSIGIKNSGGAGSTLSWSVSESMPWLSVSPTSGSATTETDTVAVAYSTSGLAAGSYSGSVVVSAGSQQQTVPVTLTVTSSATTSSGGTTSSSAWPSGSSDTGTSWSGCSCNGTFTSSPGETISTQGTTRSCYSYSGKVTIQAANVTIKCSKITAPGDIRVVDAGSSAATNFLLQGVEIHDTGQGSPPAGKCVFIGSGWGTIDHSNIYNCEDLVHTSGATTKSTVQWSYLHDVVAGGSLHSDGVQCAGGKCPDILHNRIEVRLAAEWGDAAIFIQSNTGGNAVGGSARYNLLAGGNYTFYHNQQDTSQCPSGLCSCPSGFAVENNVWEKGYWNFGARSYSGNRLSCNPTANGGTWTGNLLSDGSALSE